MGVQPSDPAVAFLDSFRFADNPGVSQSINISAFLII